MAAFEASRSDGRSDRQVVLELAVDKPPETLLTYDELKRELERNTNRVFDQRMIGAAVRSAKEVLLAEKSRALVVVRDTGYRVARANEQRGLALQRKRESDRKLQKGLSLLKNVRWDEMDPNARAAHEGTLLVMSGLFQAQQQLDSRQSAVEDVLDRLVRRVGKTEEPEEVGGQQAV